MSLSRYIPGYSIARGMLFTLRRFFMPKVTVQYPEVVQDISPRHRGRLLLLYDEHGALKCETCFQCAAACPIECIDMGGVDTKNRYHVHWGPAEQYAERREDSALRRSGRVVPDAAFVPFAPVDLEPLDQILDEEEYDSRRIVRILERAQALYGFLPVAAIRHIASMTGAWYSEIYGVASFYEHLKLEPPPSGHEIGVCRCPVCSLRGGGRILDALEAALGTSIGGTSLDGTVRLTSTDCHGEHPHGPVVVVDGQLRTDLTAESAATLAESLRASGVPTGRA